jgi:prevent-host-death family protein
MIAYTLTETRNRHGEVFDKATVEPVLVTKQQRPSHVIMSVEAYERLITRLEELEDLLTLKNRKNVQKSIKVELLGNKLFFSRHNESKFVFSLTLN